MARKRDETSGREPLAGERKIRAHFYLAPGTLAYLESLAKAGEFPAVSNRNGAVEYLAELYKARKAAREAKGLPGPVPLYEPGDLIA